MSCVARARLDCDLPDVERQEPSIIDGVDENQGDAPFVCVAQAGHRRLENLFAHVHRAGNQGHGIKIGIGAAGGAIFRLRAREGLVGACRSRWFGARRAACRTRLATGAAAANGADDAVFQLQRGVFIDRLVDGCLELGLRQAENVIGLHQQRRKALLELDVLLHVRRLGLHW